MFQNQKLNNIIFLFVIFIAFVNNFNLDILRVSVLMLWIVLAPLVMVSRQNLTFRASTGIQFLLALLIVSLIGVSLAYNVGTFKFEISGANVEKLTPLLLISSFLWLLYFDSIVIENKVVEKSLRLVLWFFILEAIARFFLAPDLFMNYFARHEAKTLGWLATTNVNGQILVMLAVLLVQLRIRLWRIWLLVVFILLATAMARSAIASLFVVLILYQLFNSGLVWKLFFGVLLVFLVSYVALLNPGNILNDGSLLSKIEFIESTNSLISRASVVNIIFGFGASYEVITEILGVQGWSPHLPALKALLYYGVFGVSYFVSYQVLLFVRMQTLFWPILAYSIFGLAGAPLFFPGLIGCLLVLEMQSKSKNVKNENVRRVSARSSW